MKWSRKLTVPLETQDGKTLRTLKEAAAYATALPVEYQTRPQWQHAAKLLMEAAKGGSVEAATDQVEKALFLDMRLAFKTKKPRSD